jgi:hypothetical protein
MGQCEESKGGVEIGGYDKRDMSCPSFEVFCMSLSGGCEALVSGFLRVDRSGWKRVRKRG